MCKNFFFFLFVNVFLAYTTQAQHKRGLLSLPKSHFTHADTLRGSITSGRFWWDLSFYKLEVKIDPATKSLSGKNTIVFKVLSLGRFMQIDLQQPLSIDSIFFRNKKIKFQRDGNAYLIPFLSMQIGSNQQILVYYHGIPREARNPPWDGGFTWTKDIQNKDWVGLSCQGLGASVWFPCKDHQYDEPDSVLLKVTVPQGLVDVSGGRLRERKINTDRTETFTWFTSSPINNYDISINIGDYSHFSDNYQGLLGLLTLDFWVLKEDLAAAQSQFIQAKPMLACFESWFGPYPFYKDGYKLIETPFLGMEHQSAIAYGNHFQNGYLGKDLSNTGLGLKWDYILIHESAHEWFGNSITSKDIADMWVHEAFATYAEGLYTECQNSKNEGEKYIIGLRNEVVNDEPIIGIFGVNQEGSRDMYFKGANMLNTIRQLVDNDTIWRKTLNELGATFYHKTVTGNEIQEFISRKTGKNLDKVFKQYLETKQVPILEYRIINRELNYRWKTAVENFDMPLKVSIASEWKWIYPTTKWKKLSQTAPYSEKHITVDPNFFIKTQISRPKTE